MASSASGRSLARCWLKAEADGESGCMPKKSSSSILVVEEPQETRKEMSTSTQIKINFDGGDLSSDARLLLFKEFLFKIGAVKLVNRMFKTNDTAWLRIHKDDANLMQVIYQVIGSYFEDDCADELTNEPVITAILEKDALAS